MKVTGALVIMFFAASVCGQNLVPNPGFEEYLACPIGFNTSPEQFRVSAWRSPTLGTPDLFHTCSWGEADVPNNWAGNSEAYEGRGYAGIYVWMNYPFAVAPFSVNRVNYREYLQTRLLKPLMKDSLYLVEFRFKLSSFSCYRIDRIGFVLTDSALNADNDQVFNVQGAVSFVRDSMLLETRDRWEVARWKYQARGGEAFITIGNFSSNLDTRSAFIERKPVEQVMLANSAYFYIDAVKVIPLFEARIDSSLIAGTYFVPEKVVLNFDYVLKNIHFAFDSYELLPTSFGQLDGLVEFLVGNPSYHVSLSGHTDDIGSDAYNLELSSHRANSVKNYLIQNGVERQRIGSRGYGKSRPLIRATSDEARSQNRRVEVRFEE